MSYRFIHTSKTVDNVEYWPLPGYHMSEERHSWKTLYTPRICSSLYNPEMPPREALSDA